MSVEGDAIAGILESPGHIYLSTSGGLEWAVASPEGFWSAVTFVGDGMTLAAAQKPGGIYISTSG